MQLASHILSVSTPQTHGRTEIQPLHASTRRTAYLTRDFGFPRLGRVAQLTRTVRNRTGAQRGDQSCWRRYGPWRARPSNQVAVVATSRIQLRYAGSPAFPSGLVAVVLAWRTRCRPCSGLAMSAESALAIMAARYDGNMSVPPQPCMTTSGEARACSALTSGRRPSPKWV